MACTEDVGGLVAVEFFNVEPRGDELADDELADEPALEAFGSADATAGVLATATPTPNAIANASA